MIAIGLGFITEEQLQEALAEQGDNERSKKPHRHIGEVLSDKGWVSYNQISEILDRIKQIEHGKSPLIKSIEKNIRALDAITLLIVVTIFFLIMKIVSTVLDYIPSLSVVILLAIVSGLVVIGFYFARRFSINAINNLIEYSNQMDILLIALQHKITEQGGAENSRDIRQY